VPFTVMAEKHPQSPVREDDTFTHGRLRVKPAMTFQGSVLVPSQTNLEILKCEAFDEVKFLNLK
jgi:hypothetical protein